LNVEWLFAFYFSGIGVTYTAAFVISAPHSGILIPYFHAWVNTGLADQNFPNQEKYGCALRSPLGEVESGLGENARLWEEGPIPGFVPTSRRVGTVPWQFPPAGENW